MPQFVNTLENIAKWVASKMKNVTDTYHICEEKLNENDKIWQEHNHISVNIKGLRAVYPYNYKNSFVIHVVFHNLSGYDSHFIIRDMTKIHSCFHVLPINKE